MDDLIARLPKAELHLHLEGTIGAEALWGMAQANHVALPVGTFAELERLYDFTSFDAFITLWLLMCACLRTALGCRAPFAPIHRGRDTGDPLHGRSSLFRDRPRARMAARA